MSMTQMLADAAVVGRYIDHEIRIILSSVIIELFIHFTPRTGSAVATEPDAAPM